MTRSPEDSAAPIDWSAPAPRSGVGGWVDRFVGPGATPAELGLQILVPSVAAIAAPAYGWHAAPGWSAAQLVVAALLAFDIAGGVITNATSSAKRWYHRRGQGPAQHLLFVTLHLLHLVLVCWLYLAFDLTWLVVTGGYLLVAAAVVLSVPRYLQRPVALLAYGLGLLLAIYGLAQPRGLEWFLPLFYLKLLVSHLPVEEPYRPR